MTNNNHPITPPPELRRQWQTEVPYQDDYAGREHWLIDRAAQWGADRELEACCEWLTTKAMTKPWETVPRPVLVTALVLELRAARRPKPPSLKEQALGLLNEGPVSDLLDHEVAVIRRALDALPD